MMSFHACAPMFLPPSSVGPHRGQQLAALAEVAVGYVQGIKVSTLLMISVQENIPHDRVLGHLVCFLEKQRITYQQLC